MLVISGKAFTFAVMQKIGIRLTQIRRIINILLLVFITINSSGTERKKVGLVLGGGGAKGVAHIGVIKVLEEAGIPIDYVVGTRMGAIVGGLYSIGYTPHEIDSIVRAQDWKMLLSDRIPQNFQSFPEKLVSERYILSIPVGVDRKEHIIDGMIKGQNIENLFTGLTVGFHDDVDFNSFQRPFACVAFNLINGEDYIFRRGNLTEAMRASMAIPAVFTPVRQDSLILVDGGLSNNFPVNVIRDMGADIIIGVDLGTSDLKDFSKLNTPTDIITQIAALYGHKQYTSNKEKTDLLFRPKMEPFNAASFNHEALDSLINRGEQEALGKWDDIIALKERIGTGKLQSHKQKNPLKNPLKDPNKPFFIKEIFLEGVEPKDEKWLIKVSRLKENSYMTINEINDAVSILSGTADYSTVKYELRGENHDLLLLKVKKKALNTANIGLRFDNEEIMAAILNLSFNRKTKFANSTVNLTGRIGRSSYARLDYAIERTPLRNVNLAAQLSYKDLYVYDKGEKSFNTSYLHYLTEIGYTDMNWLNFKMQVGVRYDYFNYKSALHSKNEQTINVKPEDFISYFGLAHYETFDRKYFPRKGVSFKAEYVMYTDNFWTYKGEFPFSAISGDFAGIIRTSSRFSITPSLYGRVLMGTNVAYPFMNVLGGEYPGTYVPHQLPFAGINRMEIFDKSLVIAKTTLRYRFSHDHFLSLTGNYGKHGNDPLNIIDHSDIWGVNIGYGYNSIAGPLNTTIGYSNHIKNPRAYIGIGYSF